MKYWAFISYSHKDTAIADWLHQKLETYRVPRELVGRPSREGEVPARIMPIFRDREELPTSSELGDNLEKSLQQSRYLIVICSPAGAQSRWVEEEVRSFKRSRGRDHIIALIAAGVPNASDRSDPENECFPRSTRFDVDDNNSPVRVEPIAADIRPEGDGRERAFLKIAAGLLGVGFDDLYQREKRRQTRRKLLAGAAVAVALLAVAGIYASIARLGQSQKQLKQEMADVGAGSKVATTDYKDVRPTNKEAEQRIRGRATKAEKALDAVDETLAANLPDQTYQTRYQEAARAVIAVVEDVRTIEEGVFAAELQKPLLARLTAAGTAVTKETFRRTDAEVKRINEKARRKK